MSNNKDFKVKNGIQPTVYHEAVGTVVSTSVSVGYDITNASFDDVTASISQVGDERGLAFSTDGTKFYVLDGNSPQSVFQYNLSTAWDLSTSSYSNNSFSISSQETQPTGVTFKTDGTKMYVTGYTGDDVNEYILSTAWDVSTASFVTNFSVSSQATFTGDLFFKPDGLTFYICGANDLYQYTLSTAWDISTASYASKTVATLERDGLHFKEDGTEFFVSGNNTDAVYKYTMSTAWDISTASYSNDSFSLASQDTIPKGLVFKDDGTKMFVTGVAGTDVNQYTTSVTTTTASLDLSTGSVFDYTPTSDVQVTLTNPAASGTSSGATLLLDGSFASSYDIANAVYADKSFSVNDWETAAVLLDFKSDGTKMYVGGQSTDTVRQYSLSTAWDITTASYDNKSLDFSAQDVSPQSFIFGDSGTKCYVTGTGNDTVYQYTVSTAWDISTASYASKSLSVGSQDTSPLEMCFNNNGTKMFVCGGSGDDVNEYTLSTAWDVSTGIFVDSFSVVSQTATPRGIAFNADGTKMFVQGQGEGVFQYSLTAAFDVSTASYDSITFDTTPQNTGVTALRFGNNGAKMYTVGAAVADTVYQYSTGSEATITYDPALQWSGGTAPTSPAIGETDVITFNTTDGGTTYQAVQAIDGAK
jgi:hypothetical protein